ncbi:MAG: TetR/AcrR family transcriptional regulator, partial [Luminiphilus sp.]|nr:TetR/AcrR family transcriptional regulator [Luminiphilus sp.]
TIRAILGALDWSFYWLYEMPREEASSVSGVLRDIFSHGLLSKTGTPQIEDFSSLGVLAAEEDAFDRNTQNRLKQEAFLKAGTRCFNQKGFSGTSLDEIAEQLQVSKGAFYYHFTNKEALLTQCFDYSLDQLERVMARVASLDNSPFIKLEVACRHIFSLQNSDQGPLVHFNAITSLPPAVRQRLLERVDAVHGTLEGFIEDAIQENQFRPVRADIVIQLLTGALNAAMDLQEWQSIESIEHSASDYFSVFFHGLQLTHSL